MLESFLFSYDKATERFIHLFQDTSFSCHFLPSSLRVSSGIFTNRRVIWQTAIHHLSRLYSSSSNTYFSSSHLPILTPSLNTGEPNPTSTIYKTLLSTSTQESRLHLLISQTSHRSPTSVTGHQQPAHKSSSTSNPICSSNISRTPLNTNEDVYLRAYKKHVHLWAQQLLFPTIVQTSQPYKSEM